MVQVTMRVPKELANMLKAQVAEQLPKDNKCH
jgi:hypothetical protein